MGELEQQRNKTDPLILSDELWLIANNSKTFAKGSKSIIRNNLRLVYIYVFRTFKNIVMDLVA